MAFDDTSIVDLLIVGFAERLEEDMQLGVGDDSIAGVVRTGRLLDDPSLGQINILVRTDPDKEHELYTGSSEYTTDAFELGGPFGNASWVRRIYVEVNILLDDQPDYPSAQSAAFIALARAEYSLNTFPLNHMKDTFGEHADRVIVTASKLLHEGGDNVWLFKGYIRVDVMTTKEFN